MIGMKYASVNFLRPNRRILECLVIPFSYSVAFFQVLSCSFQLTRRQGGLDISKSIIEAKFLHFIVPGTMVFRQYAEYRVF